MISSTYPRRGSLYVSAKARGTKRARIRFPNRRSEVTDEFRCLCVNRLWRPARSSLHRCRLSVSSQVWPESVGCPWRISPWRASCWRQSQGSPRPCLGCDEKFGNWIFLLWVERGSWILAPCALSFLAFLRAASLASSNSVSTSPAPLLRWLHLVSLALNLHS